MSEWYMITAPIEKVNKRMLKIMIEENDIHEWIIAREQGAGGYRHWQIRVKVGHKDFFGYTKVRSGGTTVDVPSGWIVRNFPNVHVEQSSGDTAYERKEGDFWTSEDTDAVRACRFGKLKPSQRKMLRTIRSQNSRQIDVFYDSLGSHGKTFMSINLWETGKALLIPRACLNPKGVSAFICSCWKGQPIIIIDIPRSAKITTELYEVLEEIKDGMVYDERYSGRARNIRGTKLVVFTNQKLDLKKLSQDRWRLHGISGEEQIKEKEKKSPETPSPKGEGAESLS